MGIAIVAVILGLALLLVRSDTTPKQSGQDVTVQSEKMRTMRITSPSFKNNTDIPPKYTCQGEDVSPPLLFSGVPQNTKSLLLILDDPDAPGGTFTHWVVYNIPPGTSEIAENSLPDGASEGMTDFGKPGYSGPCPPPASPEQLRRSESGTHHYRFKLYALDEALLFGDPHPPSRDTVVSEMRGHILDQSELVGLYGKK